MPSEHQSKQSREQCGAAGLPGNVEPRPCATLLDKPAVAPSATDWNRYYDRPARAATVTRRITAAALLQQMRQWATPQPIVAELGGANSCFFDAIQAALRPQQYHVVDNNQLGLDQLRRRTGERDDVFLHNGDVLNLALPCQMDLVFSVGLIEHFDLAGTQRAVRAHFDFLKPGGIAVISFPTPTLLYRIARRTAELSGKWIFHDERPLRLREVAAAAEPCGQMLFQRIIWPIVFTQQLCVWRKLGD
jgi:SAM-dependent methyltransferase